MPKMYTFNSSHCIIFQLGKKKKKKKSDTEQMTKWQCKFLHTGSKNKQITGLCNFYSCVVGMYGLYGA